MEHVEGNLMRWRDEDGKPRYYYRRLHAFFENGKRRYKDIRKSLGSNLERALEKAKQYDAECEAQLRGEKPRLMTTLGQFIQWYIQYVRDEMKLFGWKTIRANTKAFVVHVGAHAALEKITRADVENFLSARRQVVRPATVCGAFRDVRRMFNVAIQQNYVERNPATGIRVGRPSRTEPQLPSVEEVRRLLDFLRVQKIWLFRIVVTLVYTGARLGEVLSLTWAQVDFTTGSLTLVRRKVNDKLKLEMAKPLGEVLNNLWMEKGMPKEGAVFLSTTGRLFDRIGVYRAFKPVARRLGMQWLTLKTFRKLAATWTWQGTRDVRVAQMLLGHDNIRTTELYLGAGAEARSLAVKAIADRLNRPE